MTSMPSARNFAGSSWRLISRRCSRIESMTDFGVIFGVTGSRP
jgi:hypothetical protein